jgi:CheY-like chemotaxis protein
LDILLACVFLAPFRCRVCRERFYLLWRPSLQRSPDPPIAPLLVMPKRRELPGVHSIEPRRIEPESSQPQSNQPQLIPLAMKVDVIASAPIESPRAEPEPSQPLLAAPPGPILILESDLSIRKLLRRLLERRGYFTVELSHAEDLASELRDRSADLLIVDVSATPEIGVKDVLALAHAYPRLKILALSAESLKDNEIPGRLLALPKPFPLDSFVDCVDRLLERSSPPNTPL